MFPRQDRESQDEPQPASGAIRRPTVTVIPLPSAGSGSDRPSRAITALDAACGGARWAAMGGRPIGLDAEPALAPWDGVFFELERDRDVQATGQEPFWRVEFQKGKEMRLVRLGCKRRGDACAPGHNGPENDDAHPPCRDRGE